MPSLSPVSNWWNTMVTASRSSAVNSSTAVWWVEKNKYFTEKISYFQCFQKILTTCVCRLELSLFC